jgi:protein-tyrosine phosphatase
VGQAPSIRATVIRTQLTAYSWREMQSICQVMAALLYTENTMHMITDSLLVGNLDAAQCPSTAIGGLLFVAEEHTVHPPVWVDYAKIPMKEFAQPDPLILAQAVRWIEDHLPIHRVMVCCRAGMGRSVSVVIAYLCCVQGMSYEEAVKLVKTRRPGAMPLPQLQAAITEVCTLRTAPSLQTASLRPFHKPRCA